MGFYLQSGAKLVKLCRLVTAKWWKSCIENNKIFLQSRSLLQSDQQEHTVTRFTSGFGALLVFFFFFCIVLVFVNSGKQHQHQKNKRKNNFF